MIHVNITKVISVLLVLVSLFGCVFMLYSCDERDYYIDENGEKVYITTCSDCLGSGKTTCKSCKGTGKSKCNLCNGSCKTSCSSCYKCSYCSGNGVRTVNGVLSLCSRCQGKGRTTCTVGCDNGYVPCYICSGGTIQCKSCSSGKRVCTKCDGNGKIKIDQ